VWHTSDAGNMGVKNEEPIIALPATGIQRNHAMHARMVLGAFGGIVKE
jgi:hypothetical protein